MKPSVNKTTFQPTCFDFFFFFFFSLISNVPYFHTHFCMGLSSTRTMSSVLEGMCLNTSALSLLSICGPSMSWSFFIWSSLAISANSSRKPSRLLKEMVNTYGMCWMIKWLCTHTPLKHTPVHLPKSLWSEKIEQVKELFQVVLERGSRKQQFVLKGVIIQHSEKLQHTQEQPWH